MGILSTKINEGILTVRVKCFNATEAYSTDLPRGYEGLRLVVFEELSNLERDLRDS